MHLADICVRPVRYKIITRDSLPLLSPCLLQQCLDRCDWNADRPQDNADKPLAQDDGKQVTKHGEPRKDCMVYRLIRRGRVDNKDNESQCFHENSPLRIVDTRSIAWRLDNRCPFRWKSRKNIHPRKCADGCFTIIGNLQKTKKFLSKISSKVTPVVHFMRYTGLIK